MLCFLYKQIGNRFIVSSPRILVFLLVFLLWINVFVKALPNVPIKNSDGTRRTTQYLHFCCSILLVQRTKKSLVRIF